jgi:hypothetical protein
MSDQRLVETIDRQRAGFRGLGCPFYDRLGQELALDVESADVTEWLPGQLGEPHPGVALVVFHSVFWQYLAPGTRASLRRDLTAAGERATADAPLAWVRLEPNETNYTPAELRLTTWNGAPASGTDRLLAATGFHGGEIDWLAGAPQG